MCIKDYGIWLDIAGFQFYKPLASKLHPAGALSPVKTAFLRISNIYNYMFNGFGQYLSNLQVLDEQAASRRFFFSLKIAFLDF